MAATGTAEGEVVEVKSLAMSDYLWLQATKMATPAAAAGWGIRMAGMKMTTTRKIYSQRL